MKKSDHDKHLVDHLMPVTSFTESMLTQWWYLFCYRQSFLCSLLYLKTGSALSDRRPQFYHINLQWLFEFQGALWLETIDIADESQFVQLDKTEAEQPGVHGNAERHMVWTCRDAKLRPKWIPLWLWDILKVRKPLFKAIYLIADLDPTWRSHRGYNYLLTARCQSRSASSGIIRPLHLTGNHLSISSCTEVWRLWLCFCKDQTRVLHGRITKRCSAFLQHMHDVTQNLVHTVDLIVFWTARPERERVGLQRRWAKDVRNLSTSIAPLGGITNLKLQDGPSTPLPPSWVVDPSTTLLPADWSKSSVERLHHRCANSLTLVNVHFLLLDEDSRIRLIRKRAKRSWLDSYGRQPSAFRRDLASDAAGGPPVSVSWQCLMMLQRLMKEEDLRSDVWIHVLWHPGRDFHVSPFSRQQDQEVDKSDFGQQEGSKSFVTSLNMVQLAWIWNIYPW